MGRMACRSKGDVDQYWHVSQRNRRTTHRPRVAFQPLSSFRKRLSLRSEG